MNNGPTIALSSVAFFVSLAMLSGCADKTPQPVVPSSPPASASASTPPPTTTSTAQNPISQQIAVRPDDLRADTAWVSPAKAPDFDAWKSVANVAPKAAASCAPKAAKKRAHAPVCETMTELAVEIDHAFAAGGDVPANLAPLETCTAAPAGFVRALRAELSPFPCADVLTDPLLAHPDNLEPQVAHQLVGLSLAAKLARMGSHVPEYKGKPDQKSVTAYLTTKWKTWFLEETAGIEKLSNVAARAERSCGRGIAAVEAGVADMRVVDVARKAPIPTAWKDDRELSTAYYSALDEALEPRKKRGRDAALIGLDILAQCGYVHDAHVQEARDLLERLYAGKRVVALDGLVFPPRKTADPNALLLQLPAFYADRLVGTPDESALAAWAARGMPPAARASMEARLANADAKTKALYARARLASGTAHVRGVDFDRAVNATWGNGPESLFEVNLALVLRKGPDSAAHLMEVASPADIHWRDTRELDDLAAQNLPESPYAEYDAAYLGLVAPPDGADAAYFGKLKARFDDVAQKTQDATLKSLAEKRSREMQDTAAQAGAQAATPKTATP